jgi:phosphoribosylamine-glycine ligase
MTGGMGAFSPVDLGGEAFGMESLIKEVLERAVAGLRADRIDYRGLLYVGLMITKSGPKVLEFNVRFGDPETQCVLPRLEGDFAKAFWLAPRERSGVMLPVPRMLRETVSA